MIAVSSLVKTIHTPTHSVEILRGLSFEVPAAQAVAIMGPSGSGKSTLLGLLAGLDWPTSGSVRIDGTEIAGLDEDRMAEIRARTIGFVFQAYQLIPTLTALENVLLPSEMSRVPAPDADSRARRLLSDVDLVGRKDHYPSQLSGGEQQRVAIARAFMMNPSILLADEPTGNLDSANGSQVLDLLLSLNRERGTTLLMVTHDPDLAARADRLIHLEDGRIVADRAVASR